MNNCLSIFDIPHIVSSIGTNLDRHELAACSLVSKSFCGLFQPILWRDIVLERRSSSLPSGDDIEPHLKQSVIHNCQWTRSLSIRANGDDSRSLITTHCNQLKDLYVHIISNWNDISVVDLVTHNRDLTKLSLNTYAHPTGADLQQLTKVISASTLSILKIEFRWRPRHGWLQHVLQNLPRTLTRISLHWRRLYKLDQFEKPFPAQDWPEVYPALEVAALSFDSEDKDELVLGEFLKRCPSLKSLTYPAMVEEQIRTLIPFLAVTNLPHLETLYLGRFRKTNEAQWEDLVQTMKGRIKHFATSSEFYSPLTNIIPILARNWADTLLSLQFMCFSHIFSHDVQLILTTCPKLKHFDCMWTLSVHRTDSAVDVEPKDWICLDLEEIHIMFADNRNLHAHDRLMKAQEEQTAREIEDAYRQLGRLTKLHTLALGWRTTQAFSESRNLDMSLEGGMGQMDKLKVLRRLDINFLPRINIGQPEVEWIAKNWPELRTINGLGYRHRPPPGGKSEDEPEHIEWLRRKRPSLNIH